MFSFPVILYDGDDSKLPKDDIYYLITKSGKFIYKNLETAKCLTKVDNISFLKDVIPFAELKIPQIPKDIINKSVKFFKYVYDKISTEAGLIILYFEKDKRYELYCPNQTVSTGSVHWENEKELTPEGVLRIGTIHSHGGGSAFHSGTDKDDEKDFAGIHITIGHINDINPSIVASVVVDGNRFPLSGERLINHIELDLIENNLNNEKDVKIYSIYDELEAKSGFYNFSSNSTYGNEKRINVDVLNCDYPEEWNSKYTHNIPKRYHWDGNKLVEYSKYDYQNNFYNRNHSNNWEKEWYKNYWSKNNENKLNDKNNIVVYNKQDDKNDNNNNGGILEEDLIYPKRGTFCKDCKYRNIAIEAIEIGLYDLNEDRFIDNDILNDDIDELLYGRYYDKCEDYVENKDFLNDDLYQGDIYDDNGEMSDIINENVINKEKSNEGGY